MLGKITPPPPVVWVWSGLRHSIAPGHSYDNSMKSVSRVCCREVGEGKGRGRGEKGTAVHRLAIFSTLDCYRYNRSFPSSPEAFQYQNEGSCSAFEMEMNFILMQIKLIFMIKSVYLASFWRKWRVFELGSRLYIWDWWWESLNSQHFFFYLVIISFILIAFYVWLSSDLLRRNY